MAARAIVKENAQHAAYDDDEQQPRPQLASLAQRALQHALLVLVLLRARHRRDLSDRRARRLRVAIALALALAFARRRAGRSCHQRLASGLHLE